jgi:hypothetical protein
MTREDIIRMAREAGFTGFDSQSERLHYFAELVAAAEREACEKECAEIFERFGGTAMDCMAAIHARGSK